MEVTAVFAPASDEDGGHPLGTDFRAAAQLISGASPGEDRT
jgi:hypothetical protein